MVRRTRNIEDIEVEKGRYSKKNLHRKDIGIGLIGYSIGKVHTHAWLNLTQFYSDSRTPHNHWNLHLVRDAELVNFSHCALFFRNRKRFHSIKSALSQRRHYFFISNWIGSVDWIPAASKVTMWTEYLNIKPETTPKVYLNLFQLKRERGSLKKSRYMEKFRATKNCSFPACFRCSK